MTGTDGRDQRSREDIRNQRQGRSRQDIRNNRDRNPHESTSRTENTGESRTSQDDLRGTSSDAHHRPSSSPPDSRQEMFFRSDSGWDKSQSLQSRSESCSWEKSSTLEFLMSEMVRNSNCQLNIIQNDRNGPK
jgi:hypothetical protein